MQHLKDAARLELTLLQVVVVIDAARHPWITRCTALESLPIREVVPAPPHKGPNHKAVEPQQRPQKVPWGSNIAATWGQGEKQRKSVHDGVAQSTEAKRKRAEEDTALAKEQAKQRSDARQRAAECQMRRLKASQGVEKRPWDTRGYLLNSDQSKVAPMVRVRRPRPGGAPPQGGSALVSVQTRVSEMGQLVSKRYEAGPYDHEAPLRTFSSSPVRRRGGKVNSQRVAQLRSGAVSVDVLRDVARRKAAVKPPRTHVEAAVPQQPTRKLRWLEEKFGGNRKKYHSAAGYTSL